MEGQEEIIVARVAAVNPNTWPIAFKVKASNRQVCPTPAAAAAYLTKSRAD